MLNRSGRGAHPKLDMRPLKGRAGGTRDAGHASLMVETNLGIRANVNRQGRFFCFGNSGGKQHGDMVCADIARNIRQQMNIRAGSNLQADLTRFDVH